MTNPKNLTEAVQRMRQLTDRKEELNESLKVINKELGGLSEKVIPEMMNDQEIEKITVEGAGSVSLKPRCYAYVTKDHQVEFFEWLRENGHGPLIKEVVHPKTLEAFAKEQLSNGQDLPDMMSAHMTQKAQLRRI